jgi:dipeptidyl aminopeptidase/acylaminoacyl peptidase
LEPQKEIRPYGLWPSPVTPAFLSGRLRLDDVQWDSDGVSLLWTEGRSDRTVLVCRPENEAPRDLTEEHVLKGGVGYGGGEFTVSQGTVVFAERDGRLYRRGLGHAPPRPITPAFGQAASPVISPDGCWVAYVHSAERKDAIGLADAQCEDWPVRLVHGSDFYMQLAWSPDGMKLAWIEWDHPNMPWDGTRLMLGTLREGATPRLAGVQQMAGGKDIPVFQPAFSPDGRWLSFIAGQGEWEQLVVVGLETGERRTLVDNATLTQPAWVQGVRTYGWSPYNQRLFYTRNDAGMASLWQVDLDGATGACPGLEGYTWFSQLSVSPASDRLAVVASGPAIPARVISWRSEASTGSGLVTVERRSDGENIEPGDLPIPQPITWKAGDGSPVYGLYYPPTNHRFEGSGLPPAIVYIHGGPTSQSVAGYSIDVAFFTSRGYAFLAVNYRGSTGFGRSYMLALREHWGDFDVEDAAGGAQALIDQGLADPHRLVIRGGSAGGYTVLNALIRFPGRFKAGLCSYGVSNLFTLAMDTHKFEERYTDSLVGPLPQAARRYRDRSPIFHADRIQDPLAIFQGAEDKVVPPEQSESIVSVLHARGVPHIYRLYPGEGHGFRKMETIQAYYSDIERFLQQYVIFNVSP